MSKKISFDYNKITPFKWFIIENFPFLEDSLDALTNYELLCKLGKEININRDSINKIGENAENLTEGYNALIDYVDNYFNNIDVQDEINNKLNNMVMDGTMESILAPYINNVVVPEIESTKNTLQSQINENKNDIVSLQNAFSSLSITPIVVSSVSQMTDTSKIYVNTTDGNWYYYNGSNWVVGGAYQSTGIGINEILMNNLNDSLLDNLFFSSTSANDLSQCSQGQGNNSINYSSPMLLKKGTTITVSENFVANHHWNLRRLLNANQYQNVFNETTNTSYTLESDEYACFCWRPIDNDWSSETYTVNHYAKITSDDITSIKFYYPKKYNKLIDLDLDLIMGGRQYATLTGGIKEFISTNNRFGITKPIISKYPLRLSIKSGFKFGIVKWNSENTGLDSFVSDSGWLRNDYIVPANTYFTLILSLENDGNLSGYDLSEVIHIDCYTDYSYVDNKVTELIDRVGAYNYKGQNLDMNLKHGINVETMLTFNPSQTSSQGFDIYNDYIVQLYANNGLEILNKNTGSSISYISINFDHGDTCQFSNKKYNDSDIFPLLYVVSDTTPAKVYVIRISTTTEAEIVKTYTLGNETGYYSGQCFDFENNICYSFGYKNNDFQTDANDNKTLFNKYIMNEDSFELVESYELPFIYVIQGQKFQNGLCYLISSYDHNVQTTKIYVYDPIYREFKAIFEEFPNSILNSECEDIAFIEGSTKYEMILGNRSNYYKISFM